MGKIINNGGHTQTRTGTDKIHTILSRDCLPISACGQILER